MRLEAILFPGKSPHDYERMAGVLRASAAEHSPQTPLAIHAIDAADADLRNLMARRVRKGNYLENARKTRHHAAIVEAATDGELLCLIDADTMVLGDLSDAERFDFDLAYTVRPSKYKINTGVYFVRVSAIMRTWMAHWLDTCVEMLRNERLQNQWRLCGKDYGGINQASLGYLLENQGQGGIPQIKTHKLECAEWNSVPQTWEAFGPETRVVHIMAQLREMCFGRAYAPQNLWPIIDQWTTYDRAAVQTQMARMS